jgi:hypothetical protein
MGTSKRNYLAAAAARARQAREQSETKASGEKPTQVLTDAPPVKTNRYLEMLKRIDRDNANRNTGDASHQPREESEA